MLQAPQLRATATISLQVPTHACKMLPSVDMNRSKTSNQINIAPGGPKTAKPGTRVLEAHPSEICRASETRSVEGPEQTVPCQKVPPQVRQQVFKWKRRTSRERATSSGPGDIVRSLIALKNEEWAGIQAKRTPRPAKKQETGVAQWSGQRRKHWNL